TSANTVMGYDFLADVFAILKTHLLPVDVVTTTEASVSIALENSSLIESICRELEERAMVEVKKKQAVISLIGCRADQVQALAIDILSAINDEILSLISFSRSKRNLNIVIDQDSVVPSVKEIHRRVFE